MALYRFYGIAPEQRRSTGRDFHCENDEKAMLLGRAMIGDFKACEVWELHRYVGVAMPLGDNATNEIDAAANYAPTLTDDAGEVRAFAERSIRDAIAHYRGRLGSLTRHERLKLHILQRDLFNLLEEAPGASIETPIPDPGATVHYLWSSTFQDLG